MGSDSAALAERARVWRLVASLAPVTLVLGLLFGGALVMAVGQSLGFAPWYGINSFPEFRYFVRVWTGAAFWASLGWTFYYAVVSTVIALVLAIALALVLRKVFAGPVVFAYLYKLPLMVPYAVGIALAVLMLGNGGIFSRLAAAVGVIDDPAQFPRLLQSHAGWGVIAVYVWKQTPFLTVAIAAVLEGMGRDYEEAAQTLGAGRWQILRRVVLPAILPGIGAATVICFAFNFGAFEAPLILGGGYPETLPVTAWRAYGDADLSKRLEGMAVLVSMAVVLGVLMLGYFRLVAPKRGTQ